MVKVTVPGGVFLAVVTVKVEVDELGDVTVTGLGLNVPVLFEGRPLTLRLTEPLNPLAGARVTV
jgi:hypothetical protein